MNREAIKLTLPNDLSYLRLAQLCVRETARKFGFPDKALTQIELAVEEAVSNVIKHAFGSGECQTFDIIAERIPLGLRVIIKEKGMPFDPGRLPRYRKSDAIEDWAAAGLGMFLMEKAMDEVTFHNLGMEGKETCLIKYLPGTKIEHLPPTAEDRPEPERTSPEPAVIAEKIAYTVRRLRPEEAVEVSRCAYKSHGYTFFDEHIYYPERIVELNREEHMISAVAVRGDATFMGHAALVRPHPGARIAELTFVFVNVEYRGQGCMTRLCDFLFSPPRNDGLIGIYAYAVTNHVFTQKVMLKHGFNDCGLLLATSPATWKFKGMAEITQRISVILSYKYLIPPRPLTLYPPLHHRSMVEKLYRNIGAEHHYARPSTAITAAEEESKIETEIYPAETCAEIAVLRPGPHIAREIHSLLRKLCLRQIAAINLFLNLEDPATYRLTAELELLGFFFAGILPGASCGDALILQYLNNVELDYGKIQAHSDIARELLVYVRQGDPNANPNYS